MFVPKDYLWKWGDAQNILLSKEGVDVEFLKILTSIFVFVIFHMLIYIAIIYSSYLFYFAILCLLKFNVF